MKHQPSLNKTFIIVATVLLSIGCKKDNQLGTDPQKKSAESFMSKLFALNENANGTIFFQANSDGNKSNQLLDGYVSASYYSDKEGTKTYFPYSISVNEIPLKRNGNALAFQFGDETVTRATANSFLKLFGTKVQLRFLPNNANGIIQNNVFEEGFNLPAPVYLQSDFCKTGTLDNDNPIQITWNSNVSNGEGKIYIGLAYEGDYARLYDGSNVPPGMYLVDLLEVDDIGAYTIPSDIFKFFPVGSRCSIFIARASTSEIIDPGTGLTTAVQAFVTDQKETMQVQE